MRFFTWLLALAALLVGGAYGYNHFLLAPEVATVEARRGTAVEVVYATGAVEPRRWAKVISLQRKRIIELCDCEGKVVKLGDVLGRLDDVEERAQLTELEARARRIELDTQRIKGLVDRQAATQTSYEQSLTQLQEYQARIVAQKDRIADLVLRAPMDGTVLRRDGEVGEIAGTGANDVLFWVGQQKPLRVVADVNEEDVPRVRVGQKVLLRSEGFSTTQLTAEVADITPKGDPVAKTFRVYLALPDDTPLRIGMSIEANIVTPRGQRRADRPDRSHRRRRGMAPRWRRAAQDARHNGRAWSAYGGDHFRPCGRRDHCNAGQTGVARRGARATDR